MAIAPVWEPWACAAQAAAPRTRAARKGTGFLGMATHCAQPFPAPAGRCRGRDNHWMSIQTDDFDRPPALPAAGRGRVLSAAAASPTAEATERALRPKGLSEYVGEAKA